MTTESIPGAEEFTARVLHDKDLGRLNWLNVLLAGGRKAENAVELIVAEFLRTRLLERGMAVHKSCAGACLEITLQQR